MDIPNPKHVLKDILSSLMEECDIDDAQLARQTGIPASTISRMKINSNSNPTASTLRPIAKFFSISISQLLGDEPLSADRIPGTFNPTFYTSARMPIIEWNWINEWMENHCQNNKEKLRNWISSEKEVGQNAFALIIPTDTLGLAFRKGSTIIVDPGQYPTDGDLILVNMNCNEHMVLKQLLIDGNDQYLRSIHPEIKNIIPLTHVHQIIGPVIETRFSPQTTKKPRLQEEKALHTSLKIPPYFKPI